VQRLCWKLPARDVVQALRVGRQAVDWSRGEGYDAVIMVDEGLFLGELLTEELWLGAHSCRVGLQCGTPGEKLRHPNIQQEEAAPHPARVRAVSVALVHLWEVMDQGGDEQACDAWIESIGLVL